MKTSIAAAVAACLVLTGGAPLPSTAEAPPVNPFMVGLAMPDVDVELMLMADVSRSMDQAELDQQRQGYIAAFRSREFVQAVLEGAHGRIAVAYAEWSGESNQSMVADWTIIASAADALAFAERLETAQAPNISRMATSVAGAIVFAHREIVGNDIVGERAVVDVSGDGTQNDGSLSASTARDLAVAAGITINGLPVVTAGDAGLEGWYRANVIGGAGAFIVPVEGFSNFGEAVRRKLVLEIAGRTPVHQYAMGASE